MPVLKCCGGDRKPVKRVDISPPNAVVTYQRLGVRLMDFESIAVYEYHCPACKQRKGEGIFLVWQGVYRDKTRGKAGKSKLQKIDTLKEPHWPDWMMTHRILDKVRGAGRVVGSLPFHPFNMRTVEVR